MKKTSLPIFSLLLVGSFTLQGQTTLINDSFTDNDISATGPGQAHWWSSNSTSNNSVEATGGKLRMVTGGSGRGIHGTFGGRYVTLGTGQSLTARVNFQTPATVGTNESGSLKIALWSYNPNMAGHQLSTSASGSANPNYNALEGFMADFDGNLPGTDEDISIRSYDQPATVGRGLGTTTGWSGGSGPDAGYSILANTAYTMSLTVLNTASGTTVTASLMQGSTQLDSYSRSFTETMSNIGTLGLWANSDFAGSANTFGVADNGIGISNIQIITDGTIVPEPSTYALLAGILTLSYVVIRRRRASAVSLS